MLSPLLCPMLPLLVVYFPVWFVTLGCELIFRNDSYGQLLCPETWKFPLKRLAFGGAVGVKLLAHLLRSFLSLTPLSPFHRALEQWPAPCRCSVLDSPLRLSSWYPDSKSQPDIETTSYVGSKVHRSFWGQSHLLFTFHFFLSFPAHGVFFFQIWLYV